MKFLSILALVGLVCAVNAIHVLPAHTVNSIALVETGQDNILAVQKCTPTSPWTIHGLWPQVPPTGGTKSQDCGTTWDVTLLKSIASDLATKWPSCAGKTNENFWEHEWKKHGTCTGLTQLAYFEKALSLLTPGLSTECDSALPINTSKPANPVLANKECRKALKI